MCRIFYGSAIKVWISSFVVTDLQIDCKVLHTPETDKKLQELRAYFGADVQRVVKVRYSTCVDFDLEKFELMNVPKMQALARSLG